MKLYTIFLPLNYTDGRLIEIEKFEDVEKDLIALFGGITMSSENAPMKGVWLYKGVRFKDKIVKIEIVTKKPETLTSFFRIIKKNLKNSFNKLIFSSQSVRYERFNH